MISVCLASYQGERFIEQQLLSILAQLSEHDELIISDDGSTDDTVAIVNQLNDSRIIWAGIGGRLGAVKNFERALQRVSGQYVFLADQDDVWLPGKVNACKAALEHNVLVVTDCKVVDEQLNEIASSFFQLRKSGAGFMKNLMINSYLGCCTAFRRELLDIALPIPANTPMHDMWFGLLAECKGDTCFLAQPYILYRRHQSNVTQLAGQSRFSRFQQFQYRLLLLYLISTRLLQHILNRKVRSL